MSRLILKFTFCLAVVIFLGIGACVNSVAYHISLLDKKIWEGNCTVTRWTSTDAKASLVGHAICGDKEFTFENSNIAAGFLQSKPSQIFCRGYTPGNAQCAFPGSDKQ
ncbi:MAG TPA: hypothetical protein VG941_00935 [Candidatus Paceibacterota bacterium]|nr:hypothetical protein [Candidatus Paceibacterota bacterium]